MKYSPLALCLALFLTSCAGVRVTHTDVATGAVNPKAIYIRPFDVSDCTFNGRHHSPGELPIRKSLAPEEFAELLKEQMEEMAPTLVLRDGDQPQHGWLIEGSLDLVNAGHPDTRAILGNLYGDGASHIKIHVRVIDLDEKGASYDGKDKDGDETVTHAVKAGKGAVIYEFDVAGGSRTTGKFGSITAPGLGYAATFDYRNAAERIYEALDVDEFKLGTRDSVTIR